MLHWLSDKSSPLLLGLVHSHSASLQQCLGYSAGEDKQSSCPDITLNLDLLQMGLRGFPGGSVVRSPPAKQKTQAQAPDWEDPLEKEMATHASMLAWKISWTVEPVGPWGR